MRSCWRRCCWSTAARQGARPAPSWRRAAATESTTAAAASAHRGAAAGGAAKQRHPVVYHPDMQISPLPSDHRFPMPKDHLLYLALVQEGLAVPPQPPQPPQQPQQQPQPQQQQQPPANSNTFTPACPDAATLCLAHDPAYVSSFLDGTIAPPAMRRIGLPWSQALVRRTLVGAGSAVLAARLALQYGLAVMCNGGTHHAHRGHGAGWCVFNDLAVAARAAQRDAGVGQVLMLDLDVHQGDGSATIFAGDPSVYTFSLHCGDQTFPTQVQRSDWDIALPAGTGDEEYLAVLADTLPRLLRAVRPQLVLYNAGVDVAAGDDLGLLALSDQGIAAREVLVLQACLDAGAPLAAAIGGGYQQADHAHIVARHMHLHRAAAAAMPRFAAMMDGARRRRRRRAARGAAPPGAAAAGAATTTAA